MKRMNQQFAKKPVTRLGRRLVKDPGPKNFEAFLERAQDLETRLQYEPGSGDYLKRRDELFGQKTVDELYREMTKKK